MDGHGFNLVSADCLGVLPLIKPALKRDLCAVLTPAAYASCFWPQLLHRITNAVASCLLLAAALMLLLGRNSESLW